jgi:hypothetical protein
VHKKQSALVIGEDDGRCLAGHSCFQ